MSTPRTSLIIVGTLFVLVFVFSSAFAGGTPRVSADAPIDVDAGYAEPLGAITDRTPDYRFTQVPGAVKYRVKVYSTLNPTEPVYILKGTGTCGPADFICYLRPTVNLKMVDIYGKGYYYWSLEAKDSALGWRTVFVRKDFRVYSTGFTSTFDSLSKWIPVYGTWSIIDPGYLKTRVVPGHVNSVVNKLQFTDGYVFQVKMKRKGLYNDEENFIIVKGQPDLSIQNEERWSNGIQFGYNNGNNCRLSRWDNKSNIPIQEWEYPCNVHQNDWNTLTVFVNDGMLYAYMNGVRFAKIADVADSGWVGIGGFEDDDGESKALLVDKAEVYYTDTEPFIP